ncbi:MAG TPA: MerR family transcriptional regulator, partial [Acidimicrobiia bacterium]
MEHNRHDGSLIMEAQEALTIGEVINLLKADFPDISVSKVRFLESQGLLAPGRSDGGYRQFDHHDIERLRFILGQQRDHFLPLKVIKSKLTLWERGEDVGPGVAVDEDRLLQSGTESMTRDELIRRASLSPQQLDALIDHSLIKPDASGGYSAEALVVATEARRLFSHGLEARHLRTIL